MLRLAFDSMHTGGTAPAVYNAANEIAVAAFLAEQIPFLAIPTIVEETLAALDHCDPIDLTTVLNFDSEARRLATTFLASHAIS